MFQLVGNFNVSSGGGSCMTISAAAQHDIYGNFPASAGGTFLGSGVYTVTGYVGLGAPNGGGDVTCNGVRRRRQRDRRDLCRRRQLYPDLGQLLGPGLLRRRRLQQHQPHRADQAARPLSWSP